MLHEFDTNELAILQGMVAEEQEFIEETYSGDEQGDYYKNVVALNEKLRKLIIGNETEPS